MMKYMANNVAFALVYILFMIPTYFLPYFGSNSSLVASATSFFNFPLLLHLSALAVLILITWFRGTYIDKKWLIIFPVLAAVFDLMPLLSAIPLIPTIMHLFAIILGVIGTKDMPIEHSRA